MEVETARGLVEVIALNRLPQPVAVGKGITVSSTGVKNLFDVEVPRFYAMEKFFFGLKEYVSRKETVQKKKELTLDSDPNLLARFDFTEKDAVVATNLAVAGRQSVPEAQIFSRNWKNGVLYDTNAVVLNDPKEYISTEIPGSWPILTISATAKIDYKKPEGSVLLMSRNMEVPGSVLFQISERGCMKLILQRRDGLTDHFESEPVLTPALYKTWAEYTVQIDTRRKTVTFLLDGKNVSRVKWESPFPIVLGQVDIGNSFQKNKWSGNRALGGQLADLKIFKSIYFKSAQ